MGEKRLILFICSLLLIISMSALASSSIFDWFRKPVTGEATSQNVVVNITVGNNIPNITIIETETNVTLLEDGYANLTINFTAFDADGATNIQAGQVNLTRTNEVRYAENTSCTKSSSWGNYANFSCTVRLWYYDSAGYWNITASVNDTSNALGQNKTGLTTINQLSALVLSPATLSFTGVNPGSTNKTAATLILLNNTGNKPIASPNVEVNATDLVGEANNLLAIYAANFSMSNSTGSSAECAAATSTGLVKSTFTGITNAALPRGNHSANDGSTGQEQLYPCLKLAGSELSSQSYSTYSQEAWKIRIV